MAGNTSNASNISNPGSSNSINQNNSTSAKLMAGAAGGLLGHPGLGHLGAGPLPDAPPVKVKYQRTTKGRKSQKVNLMLAAAAAASAEEAPPVPNATSPLLMAQRGNFGPPMGSGYGQMGNGGGFMENGAASGGGFQHQFYGHMHDGSPQSFYGGGGGVGSSGDHMAANCLRVMPGFEQDFMRGNQQQQRPFYAGGGAGMGGMKQQQHAMDALEQDYDALHRHHVSPPSALAGGAGGPGLKAPLRDCHGDANNNCDFSEMRMFNGIKSEFPGGEDHSSQGTGSGGGGGGRMGSPMTNANATPPDDVLEEL